MSFQLGIQKHTLLPGFRVIAKPVSRQSKRAANMAYLAAKTEAEEAGEDEKTAKDKADTAYNLALALSGIVGWESFDPEKPEDLLPLQILDPDGNPAEVTSDNITMLMDYAPVAEAWQEKYVLPFLMDLSAKNALSPSSNGPTSPAEARPTAASV